MKKADSHRQRPDPEAMRRLLCAEIPEQYQKQLSSGLTEINFSYQLRRMDEVFGIDGWSRKSRLLSVEKIGVNGHSEKTQWEASAEVVIKIPVLKRTLNHFGGSSSDVKSYALKGAVTEATSKCFQELGIGWEIYSRPPEPQVWGKSAVTIFRQGVILGWDAGADGLARSTALEQLTEEFKKEIELSTTHPNGDGQ